MTDERLAEIRGYVRHYPSDPPWPMIEPIRELLAEVDRLRAKVRRVEQLADQWDRVHATMSDYHADEIRAELERKS